VWEKEKRRPVRAPFLTVSKGCEQPLFVRSD